MIRLTPAAAVAVVAFTCVRVCPCNSNHSIYECYSLPFLNIKSRGTSTITRSQWISWSKIHSFSIHFSNTGNKTSNEDENETHAYFFCIDVTKTRFRGNELHFFLRATRPHLPVTNEQKECSSVFRARLCSRHLSDRRLPFDRERHRSSPRRFEIPRRWMRRHRRHRWTWSISMKR